MVLLLGHLRNLPSCQPSQPGRVLLPHRLRQYAGQPAGGPATNILNAANEVAVAAFLKNRIGFLDISRVVGDCLDGLAHLTGMATLDDVESIDREARQFAERLTFACSAS